MQVIIALGCVEQVRRQRCIVYKSVERQALGQKPRHQLLDIVRDLLYPVGEHEPQQLVVVVAQGAPMGGINGFTVAYLKAVKVFAGSYRDKLRRLDSFAQLIVGRSARDIHMGGLRGHVGLLRRLYPPFFDEFIKAQLFEKPVQTAFVVIMPKRVSRLKFYRHGRANGRKLIGKLRALPALTQFFAHAFLDIKLIELIIYLLQGSIPLHKIHCGLLPDARDSGYIIRAIAHECLQIDDADRLEAVFLAEKLRRVFLRLGLTHAAFDVADVGRVAYELKAVLIAGHYAAVPAGGLAALSDCAEQIVRLVAFELKAQYAHLVKYFLENGYLHGQFLGHTLALCLIAVVALVPEGGRFEVKGHAQAVGLFGVYELSKYRKETVDAVCRSPVGGA